MFEKVGARLETMHRPARGHPGRHRGPKTQPHRCSSGRTVARFCWANPQRAQTRRFEHASRSASSVAAPRALPAAGRVSVALVQRLSGVRGGWDRQRIAPAERPFSFFFFSSCVFLSFLNSKETPQSILRVPHPPRFPSSPILRAPHPTSPYTPPYLINSALVVRGT